MAKFYLCKRGFWTPLLADLVFLSQYLVQGLRPCLVQDFCLFLWNPSNSKTSSMPPLRHQSNASEHLRLKVKTRASLDGPAHHHHDDTSSSGLLSFHRKGVHLTRRMTDIMMIIIGGKERSEKRRKDIMRGSVTYHHNVVHPIKHLLCQTSHGSRARQTDSTSTYRRWSTSIALDRSNSNGSGRQQHQSQAAALPSTTTSTAHYNIKFLLDTDIKQQVEVADPNFYCISYIIK